MKTKPKTIYVSLFFLLLSGVLAGCSEKIQPKNLEQIYAEEGIPVEIETVSPRTYTETLEFNSVLTGKKESSAFALITDKIEKIYFHIGDHVKKDDIIMQFSQDNPTANYYQAKVAYENATRTYQRMTEHFETGGLSQQEFDNARTSRDLAQANWEAVQQMVLVRAPISGQITRMDVQESDNVNAEDPLFTVSEEKFLKAKIWVSDNNIKRIKVGQKVTAVWKDMTISGKVTLIDLSMNSSRKAFGVLAEFDNSQQQIPGGITASINIVTTTVPNTIVVERKNILSKAGKSFVFVHNDGVAKKQIVEIGRSSDVDVEIIAGLNEGDDLIVGGQILLDENKKVKVIHN